MAKENAKQPEVKAEAPKKERTVLTPEQRIAKLEAELEAARAKAEAKANKARNAAWDKRAKLVARRDELTQQIEAIDAEFPQPVNEAPATDETAA